MAYTIPQNNCDPRLILVDDANGGSLTRASIRAFTRQDFEDQALKEVGMDRIIAQTKEARMAGVRERSLTDLLLSRHVALKENKGGGSQSIIAPFSLVPRRNVVNANYFQIEAGAVPGGAFAPGQVVTLPVANGSTNPFTSGQQPAAPTFTVPQSAYSITVNVGNSPWVNSPSTGLKNLERFFLPNNNIAVMWKNAANVALTTNFKILAAVNADAAGVSKAIIYLQPNITDTGWAALSGGQQALYQPTAGTVILLANSTSDYESAGYQMPAINNLTLIDYWAQTIRSSFAYNDEYVKALESPLTSDFFKKFRSLPLAEQRKQQEMYLEQQMHNTFFYGDAINENQTVETYTSLPQITDPADSTYPIEFKANTFGIKPQIAKCGRVGDLQGAPLDIDFIFESVYQMKRFRETTSGSVETVDSMTDRFSKGKIRDMMIKYYKARFSADLTLYAELGQKLEFNGATVFEYDVYDLPDQGVRWAVFTDPYFDDKLSAFSAAQKTRGRSLWFIDWTDVAINVVKTNSAKRTTNVADKLYQYVITPNTKQVLLNSKTIEVRVGDANRHLLLENFSDACPKLTVSGCDLN